MGILIELREDAALEPGAFDQARALLETSPGRGPLYLEWRGGASLGESVAGAVNGGTADEAGPPRFASRTLRVSPTAALVEELRALLGGGVKLVRNR